MSTINSASVVSLSGLPDKVLNQAIIEAPDGRPVQFFCRQDGSIIMAEKKDILAEIAVRKLNKEIASNVSYYDKSYIDFLRFGPVTTCAAAVLHTANTHNVVERGILGNIGNACKPVEVPVDHFYTHGHIKETFLDKMYKFFDKFSITFTTGVDNGAVKATEGNEGTKVSEILLDTRKGPSGISETIPGVETKS
jgi:hypothetical protein